jgi:mutual gliding-motility protein MglA
MAYIDSQTGDVHCKIVYYGPAAGGKSSSIQYLYDHIHCIDKSPITVHRRKDVCVLTCNFLLSLEQEYKQRTIRYHVSAVSGANLHDKDRIALLEYVDGVIFVADIQKVKLRENYRLCKELFTGLRAYHIDPVALPFVWQYNKQDIPEEHRLSTSVINERLNILHRPYVESVAWKYPGHASSWQTGDGVLTAFMLLHNQLLKRPPFGSWHYALLYRIRKIIQALRLQR